MLSFLFHLFMLVCYNIESAYLKYFLLTTEIPSTICTSSCNTQLTNTQYQICCNPINYGNFIKVTKENADKAYLVCPLEVPDWCNN